MGFTQHGDQTYVFGFNDPAAEAIAAAVGIKPQTLRIGSEPEFTAEAKDESGMTAAYVVGDDKHTFAMEGYVVDVDLFKAASSFEFDSKTFIINKKDRDTSNQDFQKGSFEGVSFAQIS